MLRFDVLYALFLYWFYLSVAKSAIFEFLSVAKSTVFTFSSVAKNAVFTYNWYIRKR